VTLPPGFLDLPAAVYAGDPCWIPEDAAGLERAFDATNPWFERGSAQAWCTPGRARLAVFHDPLATADGTPVAFFGCWEVTEEGADAELFARAERWARDRGARALFGPVNFSTFGRYRLRVAAETGALPFPDEPYNPTRYPAHLLDLGFTADQHYLTQMAPDTVAVAVRQMRHHKLQAVLDQGFRITALDHATWLDHLPQLYGVVDAMFRDNFAYTPLSQAAFEATCGPTFIRKACPRTSVACWAPDGSLAGFFLVFPHWGPLLVQGAGGPRLSAGELDYATHLPALQAAGPMGALSKTVGVAPAHRGAGLMTAMTLAMFERGHGLYDMWYGAMIKVGNPSGRYADGHTTNERWYALFRKDLYRRKDLV
jgi:GNAT superfamily N-acetyltransferase